MSSCPQPGGDTCEDGFDTKAVAHLLDLLPFIFPWNQHASLAMKFQFQEAINNSGNCHWCFQFLVHQLTTAVTFRRCRVYVRVHLWPSAAAGTLNLGPQPLPGTTPAHFRVSPLACCTLTNLQQQLTSRAKSSCAAASRPLTPEAKSSEQPAGGCSSTRLQSSDDTSHCEMEGACRPCPPTHTHC